jgi:hypothetical protein
MKAMTWRDVLDNLKVLNDKELDMDATVHLADVDEFIPLAKFRFSDDGNDVLDPGHPYMMTLHEPEE